MDGGPNRIAYGLLDLVWLHAMLEYVSLIRLVPLEPSATVHGRSITREHTKHGAGWRLPEGSATIE